MSHCSRSVTGRFAPNPCQCWGFLCDRLFSCCWVDSPLARLASTMRAPHTRQRKGDTHTCGQSVDSRWPHACLLCLLGLTARSTPGGLAVLPFPDVRRGRSLSAYPYNVRQGSLSCASHECAWTRRARRTPRGTCLADHSLPAAIRVTCPSVVSRLSSLLHCASDGS